METQLFLGQDKIGSLLSGRQEIEDYGGVCSPSFVRWAAAVRAEIKKICKAAGGLLITFSKNHYDWSCFVRSKSGQLWYISCCDVRHFPEDNILYRTAKDEKDYTGGSNQYVAPPDFSHTLSKLCSQ